MLTISNLTKKFGKKDVLKSVNFSVSTGTILGLVGKNGAGKTTIFHSILNFLDYSGQISFNEKPISEDFYSNIGYLPEERSLMEKKTVAEQILYFAELKGMNRKETLKKIPTWMKRLHVKGEITDKIKDLSKGNQQKIQLIITLIHEPQLIILDEPFSGLDPINTEVLKQVILEEKERGAAIIFSDHTMSNVEEVCDDIVILKDGEVVVSGSIQDVRLSYGRTRIFVSSDWDKEQLENLPNVIDVSETKQGTWKLILSDESVGENIFDILSEGHYISTFDHQPPTIDEIFKMVAGG